MQKIQENIEQMKALIWEFSQTFQRSSKNGECAVSFDWNVLTFFE